MDASFQVRLQSKQLEGEASRLQKEAAKERNMAKVQLKRGDKARATIHAQNSVRFEKQAEQTLQQAGALAGYAADMRSAETTAQTAATMGVATGAMETTASNVNITRLTANRQKMDGFKQSLGAANDMLCSTEADIGLEAGSKDLVQALEEEIQAGLLGLGEIPLGRPMSARPSPRVSHNQAFP
jgi:hypothetical protein